MYYSLLSPCNRNRWKNLRQDGPIVSDVSEDLTWTEAAQGNCYLVFCLDRTENWFSMCCTDQSRRDPKTGREPSVIACIFDDKESS